MCNCVLFFMLHGLNFIHLWWCGAKPRTPKNWSSYFSLCLWNFNSLPAHNFSKLSLIEACNTHHDFYVICLSETYVDSSYADDDTRLKASLLLEQIILIIVRDVELVFILKNIWLQNPHLILVTVNFNVWSSILVEKWHNNEWG